MRLALAALVLVVGGVGPGWGDTVESVLAKLQAQLELAPGSFVGPVPGGYLQAGMHSTPLEQLTTLPVVDVDKGCKNITVCVSDEQEAYDEIKAQWADIDISDRNVCLAIARYNIQSHNPDFFYNRIKGCLSARFTARQVIESHRPRHFQP